MIKGFKIRIYPTKEQEQVMWKHIGATRWMYNFMLAEQIRRHKNGEKHMSSFDMNKYVTQLKRIPEYAWLSGVSVQALYRACADLSNAYNGFFAQRTRFPKFKSRKHAKPAFPLCDAAGKVWFAETTVHLPIIGKVKYKTDHKLPLGRGCKFINPRIAFVREKWILSFGMECENQAPVLSDFSMGIDLGIKETMVVAYSDQQLVFHNINKSKAMRSLETKKRMLQRSISRKYEANKAGNKYVKTSNIARMEDELRRVTARQANIRLNYIHQCTHALVSLLPKQVVMEDLNVMGMMRNRHLARAIQEQCFYEIYRQMRYKCEWNGIRFVTADRFYPSSKTCSNCGCVHTGLKLSDRTFVCPECGFTIDRDYQAALNLMRYTA